MTENQDNGTTKQKDKRSLTSAKNFEKARLKKLELLKKKKEEAKKQYNNESESESETDYDSDSSEDEEIVIRTNKRRVKKETKEPVKTLNPPSNEPVNLVKEINDLKSMMSQLAKEKKRKKKNVNVKIVKEVAPQQKSKDPDLEMFKKMLLSQIK